MNNIVERLRQGVPCKEAGAQEAGPCKVMNAASGCDCAIAADTIDRLRAALWTISLMDKTHEHDLFSATCVARAALGREA